MQWRLQVLEARLKSEVSDAEAVVTSVSLAEIEPPAQAAVLDALAAGGEFPVVLVGESAACAGALDLDATVAAVRCAARILG